MTDTMWALLALVGIGVVVIANSLRTRRTGDISCLAHFFVPSEKMTTVELVLNRSGILIFVLGIVVSILL